MNGFANVLVLLSFLFSISCCNINKEVNYQYNDIVIKRQDTCGKTYFYYQKGDIKNDGVIWAEYSGINDGFKGYLKFEKDGKVTLLSGDGYFQSRNIDTTIFDFKYVYSYNRPKIGENVCLIMLSTRYEKEFNDSLKTGITIIYR